MNYYLSIDIGASSGRHIITYIKNEKLIQKEIYRFDNKIIKENGQYFWDVELLFEHIIVGLKLCKEKGMIPYSLAIDTWAVDYVLLDTDKKKIQKPYSYRDNRTKSYIDKLLKEYTRKDLFYKTGIQHQNFNTIFQLYSESEKVKSTANYFLMIPDYFNFKLTGKLSNEYTNLSTTQLLNHENSSIDDDLRNILGFKHDIFQEIIMPGSFISNLTEDIAKEVGFDTRVIATTSHDTASAFLSSKVDDSIIISSGTWSLIGTVVDEAIINQKAKQFNFSNEGAFDHKYRFLKNIMGLWIIQEVARNIDNEYSFSELSDLAYDSSYNEIFDVNDERFIKPKNMIDEIILYFEERNLSSPQNINDIARTVFKSLAFSYSQSIKQIEKIMNKTYSCINIIGGGSKNKFLNEEIERICKKNIVLGPVEATALGNAAVQMIASKEIKNIEKFKEYLEEVD